MIRSATLCLLIAGCTASAHAQTPPAARPGGDMTRVSAASATVHSRCDEGSPVRTMLARGESVQIVGFQESWVLVRVPVTNEEGCMRRSQLERVPAMDRADEAQRARRAATGRGAGTGAGQARSPIGLGRAVISLNGGWQAASDRFSEETTFEVNQETARFTSSYEVESNATFDLGGAVRLWQALGAGVAVTRFSDSRDIAIEGTIPHPLLFERDRAISGTADGEREELSVHVNAVYFIPAGRKMQVIVFGGPTFFSVKQSVVTEIDYAEEYPFDEATLSRATVTTEDESKVGFNVGADVAYYFSDMVGVGGIVRFSRASVPFSIGDLDVGGVSVGVGVRIRIR